MQNHPANAVILVSGGLDSAVALAVARRDGFRCHALSIDYGQRHRVELEAARRIAAAAGVVRHAVVAIDLRALGGSALTDDSMPVPKGRSDAAISRGVPSTYVPARNLVFLSLAVGWAETLEGAPVFIGVNQVDYSGYPDCRTDFIRAFESAAAMGTRAGTEPGRSPVRIHTPLATLSKAQIIRLGADLGVDFSMTTSCYDPGTPSDAGRPVACGRCDSCIIRRRGFAEAGVPDPTAYAVAPPVGGRA
jgi:7-cyano-7-deazaguanine synthase